ncbi:hypothetical protein [Stieleria varia]|uniref:Uncharacterized protein n=1 Tax=Stieleria varia TaxID=2528005 RepID=A0A5C6B1W8_9BACT|nr:hypothetical protein [Stieleria varia]TWU05898.1 hypothetical protein Pla52n_16140 [Stieleria varia]
MFSASIARLAGVVLLATFVTTSGCSFSLNQDPATTVTIKVSGVDNESDRDALTESLKDYVDGNSHSMSSTSMNGSMTIKLSPVTDVKAFSEKIDFGKVTAVDGRTVTVEYGKE